MGLVQVIAPDGTRGTVDEKDVPNLPDGARVVSHEEIARERLDEEYAKQSLGEKALGYAKFAGPATAAIAAALGGGKAAPELEAYREGTFEGATAGIGPAVVREGTAALEGEQAARAYAARQDELQAAHGTLYGAGQVAGMVGGALAGGAGSAARAASPVAGLGVVGAGVEEGVTRGLGGLAAKGALGKAATQGAALAVRGAVEGGAYAGIEQVSSDVLHDTPTTGEKLYAAASHGAMLGAGLGGALGIGGSLLGSGASKVGRSLLGGAEEVGSKAGELVSGTAESTLARKDGGILSALSNPDNAARGLAQDQAWKAVGAGFGLQSTRYAKEAAKYFGGTRELGEVALKYGLVDTAPAGASPFAAAKEAAFGGTPDQIAVRAATASDSVGTKIGAITDASNARIRMADLGDAFRGVRETYDRIAGNEHVVNAIDNYIASLDSKLPIAADGTTSVQALLEQRKGLDTIVYRETKTLDPGRRVAALREVRSKMEGVITDALDEASGKVPGAQRAEYQALKRDYHALRILTEAAEDSAARSSKAATFGLGEKMAIAGAIAGGHLTGAPVLALGGKVLRERGNAAAAAFLARASEQGTFSKLLQSFNAKVSSAAAGAMREPEGAPQQAAKRTARQQVADRAAARAEAARQQDRAQSVVKWAGEYKADPTKVAQQVEEAAAIVGRASGPKAAESYSASVLRSVNFIAAHIPIKGRRDPLDPRSVPPLTSDEADRLLRATKYALHPMTVFDDFERGVVTPEGLRAAKVLVPDSFAEFQLQLQEHLENHMLRNGRLTMTQRLRIDKLLQFPAGAEFKPPALARLQANLMKAPEEPPPAGPNAGGPMPPPLDMKIQQSGFDSIEARRSASG